MREKLNKTKHCPPTNLGRLLFQYSFWRSSLKLQATYIAISLLVNSAIWNSDELTMLQSGTNVNQLGDNSERIQNHLLLHVLRPSMPGCSGLSIPIRTRMLQYSQGDGRILKGRAAVFHKSANVVSSEWSKSASAFDLFLQKNPQSVFMWSVPWIPAMGAFTVLLSQGLPHWGRSIYWKMNDRDRTVPSPWSSCFLIWDCKKAHPPVWTTEQL